MYFDHEKADRAVNFIKQLKHTKGKWRGVPFTMMEWQEQALRDIFGTMRDNGYRQYSMAYWEVPKKNGKSEIAAAVALQGLCADDEWAAEVYGCAADRAQASLVFDVAVGMVEQNPTLSKKIKIIPSQKRMVYLPTRSFYQVLSSESYSKHGLNVSRVIFDELHAQPNRDLWDVMTEGSGDAREQPLFFVITTAGDDPDRNSIGWEVHQYAIDILTGVKYDPTFYALIYGLDKENRRIWKGRDYEVINADLDDEEVWRNIWTNEEIWAQVNPSIGHTISWEKVRDHFNRAQGNLARERNFRWLRLNSWETLKTYKWLGLDFWDRCEGNIDIERLKGRPCFGGLDLSSTIDLTAFVLLFPPDDINREWMVLPWFWVPEENIDQRVREDKVPYDIWVKQGFLEATPGNVIDYKFIEKKILELAEIFDIQQVGYDPYNAMQTAINLQDKGLVMVEVRQGFLSMSPPMKEVQQLVMSKKIRHNGHPILRWNVGNVAIKTDENENIRPVKNKSTERIDGLVALVNAMARAMLYEPQTDVSKYASGEFLDKLWG